MTRKFPPPSQLLLGIALTLFLLTLSNPAQATAEIHKSYVCKYVGKPGVDEVLQTGNNPIWLDNHSLTGSPDETFVGEEFSDAQGRSVVIVANTDKLDPEPTIDDCPAPETPSPTTPPPTTPPPTTTPPSSPPGSSTTPPVATSGTTTPPGTSMIPPADGTATLVRSTALTGSNAGAIGLGALGLASIGLGLLWFARKRTA